MHLLYAVQVRWHPTQYPGVLKNAARDAAQRPVVKLVEQTGVCRESCAWRAWKCLLLCFGFCVRSSVPFPEMSLIIWWEMEEDVVAAPYQEEELGVIFQPCRYSQARQHCLTPETVGVWPAGLMFAAKTPGTLCPMGALVGPSRGKWPEPSLTQFLTVGNRRPNILLEHQGEKPRASSQPAISLPRGDSSKT